MWALLLLLLYRGVYCDNLYISADKGLYFVNGSDRTVSTVMQFSMPIYSLDYHFIKEYMYYAIDGSIYRRNLNLKPEEEPVRIVTYRSGMFVTNLAVDWIHDKLYWAVGLRVEVYCADLDGKRPTLIISKDRMNNLDRNYNVTYLDYILIDPYEELMFLLATFESKSHQSNTIVKANLQGQDLKTSFNTQLKTASSLAIDLGAKRIYAAGIQTSQKLGFLCSVEYNNENTKIHYKELMKLVHPVHILNRNIYMGVQEVGVEGGPTLLYKMNLTSSTFSIESNNLNFTYIYKIKSFSMENQLNPSEFAFARCDSRVCSFQCIAFPTAGATCVCPIGEKIAPKGRNCQVGEGVKLLISNLSNNRIPTSIVEILPSTLPRQRLAYHYQKDLIFYYSSLRNEIFRSTLSHGDIVVSIANNTDQVCAIEVDWVNNNIYWIDKQGLKSADLSGKEWNRRYITSDPEINPSCDLQVDPYEKYLFFLELGTIGRSDLLGNGIIIMQKSRTNQTVSSFTIDIKQKKLYFSAIDSLEEGTYLASSAYDFSEMIIYPERPGNHIYRMAVFKDTLYMIVYQNKIASTLYSTKLTGYENQPFEKLWDAGFPLTEIVVYHPKAQMSPDDQECEDLSCSHMCEIVEGGAGKVMECSCPRPLQLGNDRATCIDLHDGDKGNKKRLQNKRRYSHKPQMEPDSSDGNSWLFIGLSITGVVCSSVTLWFYIFKNRGFTWGNHRWEYRNSWWRRPESQREDNHFTSKMQQHDK